VTVEVERVRGGPVPVADRDHHEESHDERGGDDREKDAREAQLRR